MWHYIVLALGWVIKVIYDIVHNYGLAIILFTIVIKALLLPLNVKSQRAMKKQQKIQPIIAELQKKYANDQTKLQQEMMKVYRENNVSMSGGCMPMLIQMPILIALYQVIRTPITYMLNQIPYNKFGDPVYIDKVSWLMNKFTDAGNALSKTATQYLSNGKVTDTLIKYDQIDISTWAVKTNLMPEWHIDFNFFGLDLSKNPMEAFSHFGDIAANLGIVLLLIIPILAVLSSVLQNKISMKQSGQDKNTGTEQTQSMNKVMTWMMPLMTGYFALILPAGLGLYWIASGVVQIAQQIILNSYLEKKGEDLVVKVPESKHNNQHRKKGKKHR